MVNRSMETIDIDSDLKISIEEGDDWAYVIRIQYREELVTEYGSNFEPGNKSGKTMLRNIIAKRIDEYERDEIETYLDDAFKTQ